MPDFTVEIIYYMAFGLFLFGSALSFRDNGSFKAVMIMSCGVLADMIVRMMPLAGFVSSPASMGITNSFIAFAVTFGMATVWPAYLIALIYWNRGHIRVFHCMIAAIEIIWFVDIILLLYGLYGVPLSK